MSRPPPPPDRLGRGAVVDPPNRFEPLHVEPEAEGGAPWDEAAGEPAAAAAPRPVPTRFYRDVADAILSRNESPDLGFRWSLNPYRGCEHGCAYCYARPTHEWLGWGCGLDFESRILVRSDAPARLRAALARPSWTGETIALSGATDCYQPAERSFRLTRGCLEVMAACRQPVSIVTKNALVARDLDLLRALAAHGAVHVHLSVTTLDADLARDLEPRAASPRLRLETVRRLAAAGVPCGVLFAPIIPGLNDHEIPALMAAAAAAGAQSAGWGLLRLPWQVKEVFTAWLEARRPLAAAKVLDRVRASRGGRLNDSSFDQRMSGTGIWTDQIRRVFEVTARRHGLGTHPPALSSAAFRRPPAADGQLDLGLEAG